MVNFQVGWDRMPPSAIAGLQLQHKVLIATNDTLPVMVGQPSKTATLHLETRFLSLEKNNWQVAN